MKKVYLRYQGSCMRIFTPALIKFLISGSLNTGLGYLFYISLVYVGVRYDIALTCEYILGIVIGFLLNRYWTFSSRMGGASSSFARYLATYIGIYALNLLILQYLVSEGLLDPVLGQLLVLVVIVGASYLFQSIWVFPK